MDQKYDVSNVLYLKKKKNVAKNQLFPSQKESSRCPKAAHIFPMREDFVYALLESLLNFESSLTALTSFLHSSNVKMVCGYKTDCI